MGKWENIDEKEQDLIEIKIKIPKNTLAMIVNYIEKCDNGKINIGNIQFDEEDILELKKGSN